MVIIELLNENINYFKNQSIENSLNKSLKQIKVKDINDVSFIENDLKLIFKTFTPPENQNLEWRLKSINSTKYNLKYIVMY